MLSNRQIFEMRCPGNRSINAGKMAAIFRISSLAALAAALAAPFAALAWGRPDVAIMAGVLTVLIYWLHRANISRLLKGEEPRIGGKKSETSADVSDGDDPDTPAT